MAQKPSIPKGTRDFSPIEMVKRNYIFDTIKEVFRLYGFQPIETPAMENLSTLMGKYGEEGDKLLFRILESGDFINRLPILPRGLDNKALEVLLSVENGILDVIINGIRSELDRNSGPVTIENNFLNLVFIKDSKLENLNRYLFYNKNNKLKTFEELKSYFKDLTPKKLKGNIKRSIKQSRAGQLSESTKAANNITEKGLRYDLTVPFARFVVQYQNDITFPFKRYQIQPVWRADRPQKGRYREFYQCDVDVIGSDSLLNEAELVQIIDDVFGRLNIKTMVKINNRKILAGIAEVIGENERIIDITVAIDKLEKIGLEKVNAELSDKGVSEDAIQKLQPIMALEGDSNSKISQLEAILKSSEIGMKGVSEIRMLFNYIGKLQLETETELDLTLARGLNYYTGAIFEVKAKDFEIGSICGGGRYDDLTGIFGLPNVSGVGVSFGAERIYDVLTQRNLFPDKLLETTKVMFVNFGEKEEAYCLPVLAKLRKRGINAEIFPENAKMKKQMNYANKKEIPFVVLAGESEMEAEKFTLKNMESGEQKSVTSQELIEFLSQ